MICCAVFISENINARNGEPGPEEKIENTQKAGHGQEKVDELFSLNSNLKKN